MLTLEITQGGKTDTLKLSQDEITLGRSRDNVVVIPDRKSSRKHARIERVGDAYQIFDLESGNGTRVNGSKVDFQALSVGDKIAIGAATMTVKSMDEEEPDRIEISEDDGGDLLPDDAPSSQSDTEIDIAPEVPEIPKGPGFRKLT